MTNSETHVWKEFLESGQLPEDEAIQRMLQVNWDRFTLVEGILVV